MTPVRLSIVGVFIAAAGLVLSLLDSGLWFLGTTAGCLCSTVGVLWSARRAMRISLTDYGIEITRRAREQVPISAVSLRALERSGSRRRAFEPFCECPSCGLPTFHVFGAPREEVDEFATVRRMAISVDDVWNSSGIHKVRQRESGAFPPGWVSSTVVDRECLSCRSEWTETMS